MRLIALMLVLALLGCVESGDFLKTRDGYKLHYTYHKDGHRGVILLHGLNEDRSVWEPLTRELERMNFSYVSVDLRGHGESQGDWTRFQTEDFRRMSYDVDIAGKFLKSKGVQIKAVIGSSLGANLALKYAIEREIENLVMLSPGPNYKGIDISNDTGKYKGRAMVVVGIDDGPSYTIGQMFQRDINASFVRLGGASHGTDLLQDANVHILTFIEQA